MKLAITKPQPGVLAAVLFVVSAAVAAAQEPALKDAYKDAFLVGAAINRAQFSEQDTGAVDIIASQFNSITPENALKWQSVHPRPGVYDFSGADQYVAFGEKYHMAVIGHTLIWHNQTPKWVFTDGSGQRIGRDALLERMREHIHQVVGRYKGRIRGWDVVNEGIDDDGTMRRTPWMEIIGDDYIEKAFQFAHEADPQAELYYNDYSLENVAKREGAIALIKRLKAKGIPIRAVGLQGHDNLAWPTTEQQDETITAFADLGVKVNITELDITVLPSAKRRATAEVTAREEATPELNPYALMLPDTVQETLTQRYADLFSVFMKHRGDIERVTFWGVTDSDSWRNDWPVRGRTDYPLLFARDGTAKPALAAVLLVAASPQDARAAYKDPSRPVEQRVTDLVSRMTLQEKVSQLGHTADAIPRLGVPQYDWWNEGLHGVARAGNATVFPQTIGMAAMFDEPLLHQVADVISTEFRAKYVERVHPDGSTDWYRGLTIWSPNINIFRDPRWGRGQETYGEDPYLTSRLGLAFVTGLQGDDPKYLKTVATPKHFAVHSGPELTRHTVDVPASKHDVEDTYLPAFRATVMQGKAESVMCAYNSVNGQPACANNDLLKTHLRGDWGFKGYVVSDCAAIADVFTGHHYTKTIEEGVTASFQAGTDLICGMPPQERQKFEKDALLKAVRTGLLEEAVLDRSLRRLFSARFRLGMFDPPGMVPWSKITPAENDTDEHRQLALKAARESIVLLKNANNFLPLKKRYGTIVVIGPNADSVDALVGNYNGTPSKPVTLLAGVKQKFTQSNVIYAVGTGLTGPATEPVPSEYLFTDDGKKEHGLKAEYFNNTNLEGSPAISRTDTNVNFEWGYFGVTPEMVRNYSVRWNGFIVPPVTGDYVLGFTGEDGYRLWLDGDLIVEDWTPHRPATTVTKQMHLEAGRAYRVKVEYFQLIRGAEARLVWSILGKAEREALDAARRADLVIMALGLSPRIEGEEMKVSADGFAGGDRTKIDIPAPQQKLLQEIYAEKKPIVLVLMGGSAIAANWADEKLPAIVEAWYPGGQGGEAIADVLAGDYNPAGRLPVTFYKSIEQLPAFEDYSMANRTYRYSSVEPLYPFGYGLSYTSFAYRNARVDTTEVPADGHVSVSVDVSNTGVMAGDEVVQVYVTHPGVAGAPLRALAGFRRVHLEQGQQTTVTLPLENRQLSIVDAAGKHRIVAGQVQVWVGGGQPSGGAHTAAGAQTQFRITGEATLPD